MVLGDPVSGREFYNRNKEMAVLFSTLRDYEKGIKKNLAIIGLRKIGKTSLIEEFIRKIHETKREIICLEIYLPEQNPKNFLRSCIGSIAFELLKLTGYKLKTDSFTLSQATSMIGPGFPRTALAISNLMGYMQDNNLEEGFNYLFSLFNVLREESNYPLIVFLDEFQRLHEYAKDISSPIDKFREKIMNQKKILYVISGSAVGMLNKLISSTNSPLYGHFEKMHLRGFDFKDAYSFIVTRKPNILSLGDVMIGFLYEITNGNPFYLDILLHDMVRSCKFNKKKAISEEVIENTLIRQIFSAEGRIYSYFNSLIEQSLEKSGSKYYIEIIKSIASGNRRPSQISKNMGKKRTTLPYYLKKLQEIEIIKRVEREENSKISEYEFVDSLFELWIKQVYSLRKDPLLRDINLKMRIFKDNMSKIISNYSAEIGRGNESRIRELFTKFNCVSVSGLIIPKFDKVDRKIILGEEIDIFCKKNGEVWIAEVTKSNIDIYEIENIKQKTDKIKTKENVRQVIVISIKEIDSGAIDLCKRYNFKVWTLETVNKLLKKFGMFKILI